MSKVGFVRRIWCRLDYIAGTFMKEVLFLDSLASINNDYYDCYFIRSSAACVIHVCLFSFPHSVHWPFLL